MCHMALTLAVSGDSIINRPVSRLEHAGFRSIIRPFQEADVGFTHLETNILDYDDEAAYPAAEAGGTWMRSPPAIADELGWMGIDLVSHASNHALDYSYGGLRSTWQHLEDANIEYAGTGETLGDARAPAYVDTPAGRVGLVSMASSIPRWSRAGNSHGDVQGRPGQNPMRFRHAVDDETLEAVLELAGKFSWWAVEGDGGVWRLNPSGLHNTVVELVEADETKTLPHERDLAGNKRAVADAAARAEIAVAHLHTHEFAPGGTMGDNAAFVETVAREFVDAGADVVVVQGSHSPLRPVELYDGSVIFYDPGDFFRMSDSVERLPTDFYERYEHNLDVHPQDATPSVGLRARKGGKDVGSATGYTDTHTPPGGYHAGSVAGNIVPYCTFEDGELVSIEIHPGHTIDSPDPVELGVPARATGDRAREIIEDLAAMSEPYGTTIAYEDELGIVEFD